MRLWSPSDLGFMAVLAVHGEAHAERWLVGMVRGGRD